MRTPSAPLGEWKSVAPMKYPRVDAAAAAVNGRVHAIGGEYDPDLLDPNNTVVDLPSVEMYTP